MTGARPPRDATALVVLVPEADPVVGEIRARFDSSAADGMPSHVTVLWPFAPAKTIDGDDLRALAAAVACVRSFRARFRTARRFGDAVLWLAPEPSAPFAALTDAIESAFPAWPAYEGAHEEPVPHLTIAAGDDDAAIDAAESLLPDSVDVRTDVASVAWMEKSAGRWRVIRTFPLGA